MTTPVIDIPNGVLRDIALMATLRQAAIELSEEQVGALIVRDGRGVLGIVTEMDIARALADDADPDYARVRDHMTDAVVTVDDGATLEEAARLMGVHHIRHILVIDRDGEPVGVVSARDVLRQFAADDPVDDGG